MTNQPEPTTTPRIPLPPSVGSPYKYETHILPHLEWVRWWRRDGLNQDAIANRLGVGVEFFRKAKQDFPELAKALERGKKWHNKAVESALVARALGYKVQEKEVTITTETDDDGKVKTIRKERESIKHWPPETRACETFLYNKDPENYKDRRYIDASFAGALPVEILYPPRPEESSDDDSPCDNERPPESGS